jgi:3'-phosphoadenosine 5'-phosphosulfate sulfotransferase (PAPS reductase)/FAD synthetase
MRAYTLPEGNVQISFSGGRTSAYMLHQILEANGGLPDRAKVVFSNTGREMPETLDFIQEVSARFSVPIVWVEDAKRLGGQPIFNVVSHNSAARKGEPFAELIHRKNFLPNQNARFCTEHLKILPARRYLISLGWTNWTNTLGIRADEAQRVKPSPDKRVKRWFPLHDAGTGKADVLDWWTKQPFDLQVDAGYGNCDGCFLKSEAQLAALCRDHPEKHEWWEAQEKWMADRTLGHGQFRRDYSRRAIRWMVENQGNLFNTEGALCQANSGECIA